MCVDYMLQLLQDLQFSPYLNGAQAFIRFVNFLTKNSDLPHAFSDHHAVNHLPYLRGGLLHLYKAQGAVWDANRLGKRRRYEEVLSCKLGGRKQGKDC